MQAVSLAETTELAIKALRSPAKKEVQLKIKQRTKGAQGERGGGCRGYFPRHGRLRCGGRIRGRGGSYSGRGYVPNRGCGGKFEGRILSAVGLFDPQACCVWGKRDYLGRDYSQAGNISGGASSNTGNKQQSVCRGTLHGRGAA